MGNEQSNRVGSVARPSLKQSEEFVSKSSEPSRTMGKKVGPFEEEDSSEGGDGQSNSAQGGQDGERPGESDQDDPVEENAEGPDEEEDAPRDGDGGASGSPASTQGSDTRDVLCRVKFNVANSGIEGLNTENVFRNDNWRLPMSTSVESFARRARDRLVAILTREGNVWRATADAEQLIEYEIDTGPRICNEISYQPSSTQHPVENLEDLFIDPDLDGLSMNVTIDIRWVAKPTRHPDQPEYAYERAARLQRNLTAADILYERRNLRRDTDRHKYTYIWLGWVPRTEIVEPKRQQYTISNGGWELTNGEDAWLKQERGTVPFNKMLVGFYTTKPEQAGPSDLRLITVEAWEFDEWMIGDCADHWVHHTFSAEDEYREDFEGVETREDLHDRIKAFRKAHPDQACHVPFMPTFSRNMYKAEDYGLGMKKSNAEVVVRFVNHIKSLDDILPSEQWLPFNYQSMIGHGVTPGEVQTLLIRELQDHVTTNTNKSVSKKLFREPLKDTWTLKLWLLPHGQREMFRWPTGYANSWNSLSEFLNKEEIKRADATNDVKEKELARALYMEAHIVPKENRPDGQITGTEPVRLSKRQRGSKKQPVKQSGTKARKGRARSGA